MTDEVLPGDTYMLCSDGLNDMISDEKIEELMNAQCSANALCEAAIAAGGFDNVSTCIFHIYPSN
jgi:protein phosphatase